MVNSRQKGVRAEREFANLLKQHGFDARRGQQYSGIEGEDVVGLPGFHIEVKRRENVSLEDSIKQARAEAKDIDPDKDKIPIVAHRKNRGRWRVTMDAEDWIKLIKEG